MAEVTTTPIAVSYRDEGFLNAGISASATTITVSPIYKYPSGVKTKQGWNTTGGYAEISLGAITEVISFGAAAVDGTTKVTTLTDVRRGISQTGTTATFSAGTGRQWGKGARIRVIDFSNYIHQTAFKDKANTFTEDQTIENSNKVIFGGSSAYIWTENSGTDLKFKDANNSERTLTQLSSLSGSNDKFKISSDDTTENYAASKLTGGDGITVTETNGGSNETLDFDIDLASDPGLEFSSGALRAKIGSRGIVRDANGLDLPSAGSSGNVLVSNGSVWAAAVVPASRLIGSQTATQAGDTIGNTGTATDFASSVTIPAGSLATGDIIEIYASGYISTAAANTACAFTYKLGSTAVVISNERTLQASMSNFVWEMKILITVRSAGASGTLMASGKMLFNTDDGVTPSHIALATDFTGAPDPISSFDTTGALACIPRVDWTTADGSNTITMQQHYIILHS